MSEQQPNALAPSCAACGALLADPERHSSWHAGLVRALALTYGPQTRPESPAEPPQDDPGPITPESAPHSLLEGMGAPEGASTRQLVSQVMAKLIENPGQPLLPWPELPQDLAFLAHTIDDLRAQLERYRNPVRVLVHLHEGMGPLAEFRDAETGESVYPSHITVMVNDQRDQPASPG